MFEDCYILERNKYTPAYKEGEIIAYKGPVRSIRIKDGAHIHGKSSNLTTYLITIVDKVGTAQDVLTRIRVYLSYDLIIGIWDDKMHYYYSNSASYSPSSDRHKLVAEDDFNRTYCKIMYRIIRVDNNNNRCAVNNMNSLLDRIVHAYVNNGVCGRSLIDRYITFNPDKIFLQ